MGRAVGPCVPERVGEDQAALGVRVRHLDGQPRGGVDDVRRPDRVGPDHVLADGEDPDHVDRQAELGDRAHRGEHRRAAGHVALLAHDVGLRLEEVAAGVERHGLADERDPRARARVRGLVAQDDEPRRRRARPADGGERREAGGGGVEHVDAQAGDRGGAIGEARGRDDVRRRVDELAGDVRPARDELGPAREPRASSSPAPRRRRSARRRACRPRSSSGPRRSCRARRPRRWPAPGASRPSAASRRAPRRPSTSPRHARTARAAAVRRSSGSTRPSRRGRAAARAARGRPGRP